MKTTKKYSVNEDYFSRIDSQDKAYFLGLMASDGCITGQSRLIIGLAREDESILGQFKDSLSYTGPLLRIKGRTEKHKDISRLQINNSSIVNALDNLGITRRKSLTLKFPDIPEIYYPHFIRGYFDGDGSIGFNNGVMRVKFVGTFDFMSKLKQIFTQTCSTNDISMYQPNKSKNTWYLTYGGDKQCVCIYEFMYRDAKVFLPRKKEKFMYHISNRLSMYSAWILEEELEKRK